MKKAKLPGPPEPGRWNWVYKETTHAGMEISAGMVGGLILVLKTIGERNKALDELRAIPKPPAVIASATQNIEHAWAWSFWLALIALLLLALRGAWKIFAAMRKDAQALDRDDPMHLLGPLRVLHALICARKGIRNVDSDRPRFRVTIHRVIRPTKKTKASQGKHQQCVPYVGGKAIDPAKVVGRTWPNSCGIVGKVIRAEGKEMKQFVSAKHVTNEAEYYEELSDLFGYDLDEARKLQPMRLSSIAIPIASDSQVIGVIYCDSSERDFFDEETIDLCVQISTAVAHHIDQTYRR